MNANENPIQVNPEISEPKSKSTRKAGKAKRGERKMATATKARKKSSKRTKKSNDNPMAVLSERREQYTVDKKNLTAGGNPTVSTGDSIAKALTGLDIAALKKVAKENGVADRWSAWEQSGLNPGQFRMNLGNVLRGIARRGEAKVTVNGKAVK